MGKASARAARQSQLLNVLAVAVLVSSAVTAGSFLLAQEGTYTPPPGGDSGGGSYTPPPSYTEPASTTYTPPASTTYDPAASSTYTPTGSSYNTTNTSGTNTSASSNYQNTSGAAGACTGTPPPNSYCSNGIWMTNVGGSYGGSYNAQGQWMPCTTPPPTPSSACVNGAWSTSGATGTSMGCTGTPPPNSWCDNGTWKSSGTAGTCDPMGKPAWATNCPGGVSGCMNGGWFCGNAPSGTTGTAAPGGSSNCKLDGRSVSCWASECMNSGGRCTPDYGTPGYMPGGMTGGMNCNLNGVQMSCSDTRCAGNGQCRPTDSPYMPGGAVTGGMDPAACVRGCDAMPNATDAMKSQCKTGCSGPPMTGSADMCWADCTRGMSATDPRYNGECRTRCYGGTGGMQSGSMTGTGCPESSRPGPMYYCGPNNAWTPMTGGNIPGGYMPTETYQDRVNKCVSAGKSRPDCEKEMSSYPMPGWSPSGPGGYGAPYMPGSWRPDGSYFNMPSGDMPQQPVMQMRSCEEMCRTGEPRYLQSCLNSCKVVQAAESAAATAKPQEELDPMAKAQDLCEKKFAKAKQDADAAKIQFDLDPKEFLPSCTGNLGNVLKARAHIEQRSKEEPKSPEQMCKESCRDDYCRKQCDAYFGQKEQYENEMKRYAEKQKEWVDEQKHAAAGKECYIALPCHYETPACAAPVTTGSCESCLEQYGTQAGMYCQPVEGDDGRDEWEGDEFDDGEIERGRRGPMISVDVEEMCDGLSEEECFQEVQAHMREQYEGGMPDGEFGDFGPGEFGGDFGPGEDFGPSPEMVQGIAAEIMNRLQELLKANSGNKEAVELIGDALGEIADAMRDSDPESIKFIIDDLMEGLGDAGVRIGGGPSPEQLEQAFASAQKLIALIGEVIDTTEAWIAENNEQIDGWDAGDVADAYADLKTAFADVKDACAEGSEPEECGETMRGFFEEDDVMQRIEMAMRPPMEKKAQESASFAQLMMGFMGRFEEVDPGMHGGPEDDFDEEDDFGGSEDEESFEEFEE